MDITVTEIMELADLHAHAKITEGTPAEQLPRNLLQHKMQEIFTDFFILQCKLIEARREVASLQAQLEAVGAGGVSALVGRVVLMSEGDMAVQAQKTSEKAECTVCHTGEISLQKTCHNSSCTAYGTDVTVYQGWDDSYAAPQPAAQAQPVATIYVTEDGSREVDDWKVELPVGATTLYTAAQAQPVALLVRKKSWLDGQWECAPKGFGNYGMQWADERMWVYAAPQPPAQAQEDAMDSAMEYEPDQPESMPLTQKEIIGMAREAGIEVHPRKDSIRIGSAILTGCDSTEEVTRFAALVAAAEREACALACEAIETRTWAVYKGSMDFAGESGRADPRVYGMSDGASECATAIRARSTNGR